MVMGRRAFPVEPGSLSVFFFLYVCSHCSRVPAGIRTLAGCRLLSAVAIPLPSALTYIGRWFHLNDFFGFVFFYIYISLSFSLLILLRFGIHGCSSFTYLAGEPPCRLSIANLQLRYFKSEASLSLESYVPRSKIVAHQYDIDVSLGA